MVDSKNRKYRFQLTHTTMQDGSMWTLRVLHIKNFLWFFQREDLVMVLVGDKDTTPADLMRIASEKIESGYAKA